MSKIYSPQSFSIRPLRGARINVGGEIIKTGVSPTPVTIFDGMAIDAYLPGVLHSYTDIQPVRNELFYPPTTMTEVGGNSIKYPMSSDIDMTYTVSASEIKQEFVINNMDKNLRMTLADQLDVAREGYSSAEGYFGMQEMMNLPDGVELWTNGEQIVSGGELVITQSVIDIVNPETGVVIAYIAAPYAYDNSFEVDNKEEITKEELLDVLEPSTKYFVSFEDNVVTITTAVNLDWLLSDYTSFPVVIDPSVGSNTVTGATTPGSYKVCVVADNDCHTKTDGRFLYDWTSDGGYHQESPRFDFTFTQTTPYSVGSVSAVYEISSPYSPSGEYGGLIIMEDCEYCSSWALMGN